jgi:hypothetical protein
MAKHEPYEGVCESCGRRSKHLYDGKIPEEVDDGDFGRTAVIYNYSPMCRRCAVDWGLTEAAGDSESIRRYNHRRFFGSIAESAISTVFREFGYSAFPFGYEHLIGGALSVVSKRSTIPALKLRSIPDLVVIGPGEADTLLAEVKATTRPLNDFTLSDSSARSYAEHWPEALLVVYQTKTHQVYCNQIGLLDLGAISRQKAPDGAEYISLDLTARAIPLEEYFGFDVDQYDAAIRSIRKELSEYVAERSP